MVSVRGVEGKDIDTAEIGDSFNAVQSEGSVSASKSEAKSN